MAKLSISSENESNVKKLVKNASSQNRKAVKQGKNKTSKTPLKVYSSYESKEPYKTNCKTNNLPNKSSLSEVKQKNHLVKIGSDSVKMKQRTNEPCSSEGEEQLTTHDRKRKLSEADAQVDEACASKKSKFDAATEEEYGLFVHNIASTTKKCDVKEVFKKFGEISRIILPLKRSTKGTTRSDYKNKGFAIVKYSSKKSLSAALSEKKHQVKGQQVQVRGERKTKFQEAKASSKAAASAGVGHIVYVGNIKKGTPCEELEEHFSQFGDVSNVIVCPSHAKLKKPYAQVVFSSAQAKAAVLSSSKHMLGSVALSVGSTKTDVLGADAIDNLRGDHEIFVAKLSEDTSVETLRKHFSKYGTVTRVFQPRCPKTNKPKRCAFVAFASERSFKAALEEDHEIDMMTLLVRDSKVDVGKKVQSSSQSDIGREHALFVARVPLAAGKETLVSHFSKFGEVADVRLAWDPVTKRTKSYGLVFFCNAEGLQVALTQKHKINGTEIFVKKNERKTADGAEKDPSEPSQRLLQRGDGRLVRAALSGGDEENHDDDDEDDDSNEDDASGDEEYDSGDEDADSGEENDDSGDEDDDSGEEDDDSEDEDEKFCRERQRGEQSSDEDSDD